MHQAHHSSMGWAIIRPDIDLSGEISRLPENLDGWKTFSGMLVLDAVVGGELLLLRVASRYSLSPPGVLLWALGKGLRIF